MKHSFLRGEIYYADLSPIVGSEQGGTRPVLIIQNNVGNRFASTVIVAAITSRIKALFHPCFHMNLRPFEMLLALVGYQILISAIFLRVYNERIYPASSRIDCVNPTPIILQENASFLRTAATSSGVPAATSVPPPSPPSGPRSMR